jgi:hypothetical protein
LLSPIASAIAADTDTTVGHKAIAHFVPEKRIRVEAKIKDPKGVNLVRAYFKSDAHADYLFVPLVKLETDPNSYAGCLPAPAASATSIEYLFLAVNGDRKVVKTAPANKAAARTDKDTPSWQMGCGNDQLTLYKELPEIPSPTGAYADSVTMDVVESGARYGAIAGLFGGESSAAAVAASGASNAGTVAVAGAGISTTGIIAALAVTGGVASGGGGGSGGTSDTGGTGGTGGTTTNPFAGAWSGVWHPSECQAGFHMTWSGNISSDGVFTATYDVGYEFADFNSDICVDDVAVLGSVSGNVNASTGQLSAPPFVDEGESCTVTGTFRLSPVPSVENGFISCTDDFEDGSSTWRTGN